jgi:hypothetical protein
MDTFKYFGRDVELLLSYVKICHSRRVFGKDDSCKKKITMDDINAGYKVFLENKNSKPKEVDASLYGFYL